VTPSPIAVAALDELLLDVDPFRRHEHLPLELSAHGRLRDLDLGTRELVLGREAEVDLLVERDRERVDLGVRFERAGLRLERFEHPLAAAGRARESAGTNSRVAGGGAAQRAGACESPRAVDENAHADAFGLDVGERFDVAVLRRDGLRAAEHTARIGVRSTCAESCVDRIPTEITHG